MREHYHVTKISGKSALAAISARSLFWPSWPCLGSLARDMWGWHRAGRPSGSSGAASSSEPLRAPAPRTVAQARATSWTSLRSQVSIRITGYRNTGAPAAHHAGRHHTHRSLDPHAPQDRGLRTRVLRHLRDRRLRRVPLHDRRHTTQRLTASGARALRPSRSGRAQPSRLTHQGTVGRRGWTSPRTTRVAALCHPTPGSDWLPGNVGPYSPQPAQGIRG